ncbi:maleate cis-trans isomerase family protein [Humitalea sp. 24SJ18S-53]|uniref:maleate cis-trans isomerase family protein n=1 Tax=Humitalea sp. 24SJ18S-53 TaxID=3422307 RepID=UPI003D66A579
MTAAWHRIGMLIPSSNTSIERDYPAWMPRSLSFHFARLTMTRLDADGMAEQLADLRRATTSLADAKVDAVLLCQTAASYWMGQAWDAQIRRDMQGWCGGAVALTAAQTVLDALAALGVTRVGFAAPFPQEIGQASLDYLAACGIATVATQFGGYRDNFAIAEMPAEEVIELACGADHPDAQAVLMPGGNMPCLGVADAIEARIGKPIITTNQAGMWTLLHQFGLPDPILGAGRLLRERPKPIR